ncbi:hypothetical protein NQ314_007501 [Rhamnusium bicolor]|uniref:Uncharacterized protein n=1 Tax=Rhamnusium bicolor TaxID=1586634 RepID=A0AAV8YLH9_9CUCU|nr:hypothetical protein NQ314_007501 [Rhamnusium bicolor]
MKVWTGWDVIRRTCPCGLVAAPTAIPRLSQGVPYPHPTSIGKEARSTVPADHSIRTLWQSSKEQYSDQVRKEKERFNNNAWGILIIIIIILLIHLK